MTKLLKDFLIDGVVGPATVGMTRSELLGKLGAPDDWLGKGIGFGPIVATYEESEGWFYYGGSVGFFNEGNAASARFLIYKYVYENPFGVDPCVFLLKNVEEWLKDEGIVYSVAKNGGTVVVFGSRCLFIFPGYKGGVELPFLQKECAEVLFFRDNGAVAEWLNAMKMEVLY